MADAKVAPEQPADARVTVSASSSGTSTAVRGAKPAVAAPTGGSAAAGNARRGSMLMVNVPSEMDEQVTQARVDRVLSAREQADFREAFYRHFALSASPIPNAIGTKELGSIFRSLGQRVPDDELHQLVEQYGRDVYPRRPHQAAAGPATSSRPNTTATTGTSGGGGGGAAAGASGSGGHTNKVLTWLQFLLLLADKLRSDKSEDALGAAFDVFDLKRRGSITTKDLRMFMTMLGESRLSEQEVDQMIEEADADGSGTIDRGEFIEMLRK
jgi:Ca2+-binding EF-hand superfamily protein